MTIARLVCREWLVSRRLLACLGLVLTLACGLAAPAGAESGSPEGLIFTVAGGGDVAARDFAPATAQKVGTGDIEALADGGFLVSTARYGRVRRVLPSGRMVTVAGYGQGGYDGDGGPATRARLEPGDIALLPDGFLVLSHPTGSRSQVRRVLPDGTIATVAGMGSEVVLEDSSSFPHAVETFGDGSFAVAGQVVERVFPDGSVRRIAGRGTSQRDGVPARGLALGEGGAFDVVALPRGGYLLADSSNNLVWRVTPAGRAYRDAGRLAYGDGYSGDGGPARSAQVSPGDLALLPGGGYLIADAALRRVSPDGRISTIAGSPRQRRAYCGDGGPARRACLLPSGVSVGSDGSILAVDQTGRVRLIASARPRLLAAALVSRSCQAPCVRARTVYALTRAARLRIEVRQGRRRVGVRTVQGRPGRHPLLLPSLRRPGRYLVHATATNRAGQITTTRATITVRR